MRSYDDYWSEYVPVPADKYMGIGTLAGMVPGGILGAIAGSHVGGKGARLGGGILGAGIGGLAGLLIGATIANSVDDARINAIKNQMVYDYVDEYPDVFEDVSKNTKLNVSDYLTNVVGPAMAIGGITEDPSWAIMDAGFNLANMPSVQQQKIRDNIYLKAFAEAKKVAQKDKKNKR